MREPARAKWVTSAAQNLHKTYPDYFAALHVDAADLEPLCKAVEAWAAKHEVFGERDVAQLCLLTSTLGHKFWRDPRFQGYVAESLGSPDVPRMRCVQMMTKNTEGWLARLWQNDSLANFADRLIDNVQRDAAPTSETLQTILPGHWRQFTTAQNTELLAWLIPTLPEAQMQARRLAYAACALVHGMGWLRDPQYLRLKQAIEGAATPSELAKSLAAIYGELA